MIEKLTLHRAYCDECKRKYDVRSCGKESPARPTMREAYRSWQVRLLEDKARNQMQ